MSLPSGSPAAASPAAITAISITEPSATQPTTVPLSSLIAPISTAIRTGLPHPTSITTASSTSIASSTAGGDGVADLNPSPTPSQKERQSKPKDSDFPAYASRPVLEGNTDTPVPHMYDSTRPVLTCSIPNHWLQFSLRPRYLGGDVADLRIDAAGRFVYYDAQDPQFYYMTLPAPSMTLWLLIKNVTFHGGGYVKRRLVEEALLRNIQMRLVNPNRFDLLMSSTGITSAVYQGEPIALPDAVIPRVGANVDYFGLAVMRQLESLGVKVFNPSASIEISRDKMYTHQVLAAAGIPIPKSVLSRWPFDSAYIERHFGYPVILKSTSGSKGDAVWKVDSREELSALVATLDLSRPLIFQEFLRDTRGRDLRCFVVGGQVVAAMMRIASSGFKANVHQGGSVMNVQCGAALSSLAVDTSGLCLLDISGVDVLLDSASYKICEVNSSPGFAGLEKASEVNVGRKVVEHAEAWVVDRRKEGRLSSPTGETVQVPVMDEHRQLGLRRPEAVTES